MRIANFLNEQHVAYEYLPHAPAFTAHKLAKYLHVSGALVAKCVLLHGPTDYFVAVLPATCRIDTDKLAVALNGPVRIAADREMAAMFRDCEWGVVPPFGTLYDLPTVLEETIAPEATLVMETHTHVEAIRFAAAISSGWNTRAVCTLRGSLPALRRGVLGMAHFRHVSKHNPEKH